MRICLASDFFYPNKGGVEVHILNLAVEMTKLGHSVVVVTHSRGGYQGVRYFRPGFKVYYCPFYSFSNGIVGPTILLQVPLLHSILTRERVEVVHSHQTSSPLGSTVALVGRELGCRLVHTEHSLFGSDDLASLNINKLFKTFMSDYDKFIGVSTVTCQNLIIKGLLPPQRVHRISNAISTGLFRPMPQLRNSETTVVFICRMVYRKGVELLVDLLPRILKAHPSLRFIIGGGGPKQNLVRCAIAQNKLQPRVQIYSDIQHSEMPKILNKGHIFLNTSLTQSFCMAVLQAGACGLISVSTNVGGIPQTLPPNYLVLAEPNADSLFQALSNTIARIQSEKQPDLWHCYRLIGQSYTWQTVSRQNLTVYEESNKIALPSAKMRLQKYFSGGFITGLFMMFLIGWIYILVAGLNRIRGTAKRSQ